MSLCQRGAVDLMWKSRDISSTCPPWKQLLSLFLSMSKSYVSHATRTDRKADESLTLWWELQW